MMLLMMTESLVNSPDARVEMMTLLMMTGILLKAEEDGKMITDGLTEGGVMTGFVWESKWGAARLEVLPNGVGNIKMLGRGRQYE